MTNAPFFSILVPVYNVAPYLRECLDSVLGQSCQDYELLLVDDGSTDDSGAICDEYAARAARIRVFHKPNGGLVSARRHAISRAEGAYYVFLDSDDTLTPNALETLRSAVEASGADCVIYGFLRVAGADSGVPILSPEAVCGRLIVDKRMILNLIMSDETYNPLWRKCSRASCFDGRDFSPWFSIRVGEDLLQSMEILENAGSFYILHEALYRYRLNESSIMHTLDQHAPRPDFRVSEYVNASLARLGLFTAEDYDRLRNRRLRALVVTLKRLCRFNSDRERAIRSMEAILNTPFYRESLSPGFRHASPVLGAKEYPPLCRFLDALMIRLLKHRRFNALYFFLTRIYRAR